MLILKPMTQPEVNMVQKFINVILLISVFYSSQLRAGTPQNKTVNFEKEYVINVVKISENIRIDGKLDESSWKTAHKVNLNFEFNPRYNAKPHVETEAFVMYDESNLYIGFICYEHDIQSIRANLSERDNMFEDDFFGILLDTFNDHKKAYEIFVNPFGIQGDGIWTPTDEDMSYDIIYYSEAQIYDNRWEGELKIPFKSLSFPEKETQEWRIFLNRNRPRSSREQISWTPMDRNNPALLEQIGYLKGIKNIQGGKFLHILPYIIASNKGERSNYVEPESKFATEKVKSDIGMGIKYGLSSNLNLDFVYNPDFSQVESDETQIDVNTTHALFYPEKRPFFLEGNETFRTLLGEDLVYTRTINNPLFAAKLTGKIGKFKVGYISAFDRDTPYIIPLEESSSSFSTNKNSFSNILRLKYDLGSESYIGTLITDREEEDCANRIAGIDASLRLSKNYYWNIQLVGSNTEEPDDPSLYENDIKFSKNNYTATFDGQKFSGLGFYTNFRRNAEHVNFIVEYVDFSPSFRTSNGFIRANNFRYYEVNFDFEYYTNTKILDMFNFSPEFSQEYNHQNQQKEHRYELALYLKLKGQTNVYMRYEYNHLRFANIMFKNLYDVILNFDSNPSKYFSLGGTYEFGRDIYRTSDDPRKAFDKIYEAYFELKPTSNFRINSSYNKYILDELNNAGNIFNGYTLRLSFNYQYNKNLYFRIISQYNSFSRDYELDPLIRYKLNPFTIFYIGSTYDFKKFEEPYGITKMQRQYFMKFQYLFQM